MYVCMYVRTKPMSTAPKDAHVLDAEEWSHVLAGNTVVPNVEIRQLSPFGESFFRRMM